MQIVAGRVRDLQETAISYQLDQPSPKQPETRQ
jgi:hypothetical protein